MLRFLRDRFIRWRTYERIYAELSQHSHRELYDLGIGPADIERVAREGAYGRAPDRPAFHGLPAMPAREAHS